MHPIDLDAFLHKLADASGEAILPFFRSRFDATNKASGTVFDPVTEADKAAEVVIRRLIAETFPEHGIEGEEYGLERGESEYRWVIDPIDGTRAFMAGLPVWGSLIGLMRNGRPALGIMNQPFTRERFWGDGAKATSRTWQGVRRLETRRTKELSEAILATTTPKLFGPEERARYDTVEALARITRYGCDCYAYCMVAAGQMDLVIENGLMPHDIVALIPIIEGAGGLVTSWSGESAAAGGQVLAAANPWIHEKAVKLLTA
jgi:myo-inositol-1(or 4)-monophosphatase